MKNEFGMMLTFSMLNIDKEENKRFFYPDWDAVDLSENSGESGRHSPKIKQLVINSPNLEQFKPGYFRLKPGVSASEALKDIFTGEQKHIIDCTMALILSQYNALNMTLGDNLFDRVFGSKNQSEPTPEMRRMLICPHPITFTNPLGAPEPSALISIHSVNPLSYFFDFCEKVKNGLILPFEEFEPGHLMCVTGHPKYTEKHLFVNGQGCNVIYVGGKLWTGFGLGGKMVSYEDIKIKLAETYNKNPNTYTKSSPKHNSALDSHTCEIDEIQGLEPDSICNVISARLTEVKNDTETFINSMDSFLVEAGHNLLPKKCAAYITLLGRDRFLGTPSPRGKEMIKEEDNPTAGLKTPKACSAS